MHKKIIGYLLVFLALARNCFTDRTWIHRNPRYLPFPMGLGNKLQIIAGFGVPVPLERDSVTFGLIVKTNYALPTNATQFTNPEVAFAGFSRNKMRTTLYDALIIAFERMAFGGRDCLLRIICEAAYSPLTHNGVLGQILHIILMPSTTDDLELHPDFTYAEQKGREFEDNFECSHLYKNCTMSLLDVISKLESIQIGNGFFEKLKWLK